MSELSRDGVKEQNIPGPDPDMQNQLRSAVVIFYSLHPWLG